MSNSQSSSFSTGTIKLIQDIGKLVNNCQGSDVQFKVGGGITGETMPPVVETMYAHTVILRCRSRYFAVMFENEIEWRKRSGGVIYKPYISLPVFYKILDYIYTGDLNVKTEILFEVMVAAEEMELDELSIRCQHDIIEILKQTISTKENDNNGINGTEESKQQRLPTGVIIHKILLPTLVYTHSRKTMDFFREIFSFTLSHIGAILSSRDTRGAFFDWVPTQIFQQILASDVLEMKEYDVWELAFTWACFKTKVPKSAVETHFRLECKTDHGYDFDIDVINDGDNSQQQALISDKQLQELKIELVPLLPAIRFRLFDCNQYSRIVNALTYFLPAHQVHDLNTFHAQSYLNTISNIIIDKVELWQQMRKWIVESNGIKGIRSVEDVKFKLLFRASEHLFSAGAFHRNCDSRGPTLVIVKSVDGHLFGGVNFSHWKLEPGYSGHASNFIFTLARGPYSNIHTRFRYRCSAGGLRATFNSQNYGPIFGNSDVEICDNADTAISRSFLPNHYSGSGASKTTLAGKHEFFVEEYEVFSISKNHNR